jgi:hypothetical protein
VLAKQTVALDANANVIAAPAGLFITLDNKFLLIVSIPFKGTVRFTCRPAIGQENDYRLPEGARNLLR